jgi:hypothetical protein
MDLLVGFGLPIVLHWRHRSTAEDAAILRLFWLGVAVGFSWEIPIFFSAIFAAEPVVGFLREPPLHPSVFMVAHAFWDGGLFLAGLAFVKALCAQPALEAFRWQELGVLLVWGQVSELCVELVSVFNQAWVYNDALAWNPVLFRVAGEPITLVPQLIWLAAPVVYYGLALRVVRSGPAD